MLLSRKGATRPSSEAGSSLAQEDLHRVVPSFSIKKIVMEDFTPEEHRLVNMLAWWMYHKLGPTLDVDDLRQEGYIALMKAKQRFKSTYNVRESTYYGHVIRYQMLDAVRRFRSPTQMVSTDAEESDLHHGKQLPATDDIEADMYKSELSAAVRREINALPARIQTVIRLHYYEECTMEDIGKTIGVDVAEVSRMLAAAQVTLRKKLSSYTAFDRLSEPTPASRLCVACGHPFHEHRRMLSGLSCMHEDSLLGFCRCEDFVAVDIDKVYLKKDTEKR